MRMVQTGLRQKIEDELQLIWLRLSGHPGKYLQLTSIYNLRSIEPDTCVKPTGTQVLESFGVSRASVPEGGRRELQIPGHPKLGSVWPQVFPFWCSL